MAKKDVLLKSRLKSGERLLHEEKFAEAKLVFEKILTSNRQNAQVLATLGAITGRLGLLDESVQYSQKALNLGMRDPGILSNIGNGLVQLGRPEEAVTYLEEALSINPGEVLAYVNITQACTRLGRHEEAQEYYDKAMNLSLENEVLYNNYAQFCQSQGLPEKAIEHYNKSINIKPNYQSAISNRAKLYFQLGDFNNAIKDYSRLKDLNSDSASAYVGLGDSYNAMGYIRDGIQNFLQAEKLGDDSIELQIRIATALNNIGNTAESEKHYRNALDINPDHADAIAGLSFLCMKKGEHDEAWDLIEDSFSRRRVTAVMLMVLAYLCKRHDCCVEVQELIEEALASIDLAVQERITLLFSVAKLYDESADYDTAFSRYQQANELKDAEFDADSTKAHFDKLTGFFTKEELSRIPRAANHSELPVFIVGMPRSGTSLTEQILSSHSQIGGAGELRDIKDFADPLGYGLDGTPPTYDLSVNKINSMSEEYLDTLTRSFPDAKRIIDKAPLNALHLGLISLLFPGARIIHCVRNPIDTCLSCYFQDFVGNYRFAYSLEYLANFYGMYRKLVEHWQATLDISIFELRYEDLVAEPEATTRDLVKFCGLEWEENCLHFYKTKREVHTASFAQVREPLYTKSVARYKNYEKHLGILLDNIAEKS